MRRWLEKSDQDGAALQRGDFVQAGRLNLEQGIRLAEDSAGIRHQRRPGFLIRIVRVEGLAAGPCLYRDLELGRDQFRNGVRNQRHPPLARQGLPDDANLHPGAAPNSERALGTWRANSARSKYTRSPLNRPSRTGKKMTTR